MTAPHDTQRRERRWTVYVCPVCGWTTLNEFDRGEVRCSGECRERREFTAPALGTRRTFTFVDSRHLPLCEAVEVAPVGADPPRWVEAVADAAVDAFERAEDHPDEADPYAEARAAALNAYYRDVPVEVAPVQSEGEHARLAVADADEGERRNG